MNISSRIFVSITIFLWDNFLGSWLFYAIRPFVSLLECFHFFLPSERLLCHIPNELFFKLKYHFIVSCQYLSSFPFLFYYWSIALTHLFLIILVLFKVNAAILFWLSLQPPEFLRVDYHEYVISFVFSSLTQELFSSFFFYFSGMSAFILLDFVGL